MRKDYFGQSYIIILVGLSLLYGIVFGRFICFWLEYREEQKKQTVHLFLETYATTPALLGMIEFVRLPPETPKVFAWHRMPNIREKIDLTALNAHEITLSYNEGRSGSFRGTFFKQFNKLREKNPSWKKVVIYTNMHHLNELLVPFLNKLYDMEVEHIHLFEDGLSNVVGPGHKFYQELKYPSDHSLRQNMNDWFLSFPKKKLNSPQEITSLQMVYPVTYHLGNAHLMLRDTAFKSFTEHLLTDGTIKNVNFSTINRELTPKQKELLFKMADFDIQTWEQETLNKHIFVFTFGYVFNHKNKIKAQGLLLRRLLDKMPKNTACYYKEHPSADAESADRILKDVNVSCKALPKQLPFELLLLADHSPDAVAGYSSSLFYSVPEHKIIGYIPRSQNDAYTHRLKELNFLTNKKIFFTWDILKQKNN